MAQGERNHAFEPTPFAYPEDSTSPAYVVTTAVEISTRRIRLFPMSATNANTPPAEMETPRGEENPALAPVPSLLPPLIVPARVVTSAVEIIILRTRG
jgi:hypothetical protein